MTDTCYVPLCGSTVSPGMLMCRPHWRRVPMKWKFAINDSWRDYKRAARTKNRQAMLTALEQHRAARESAVEAITPGVGANG